MPRVVFAGLAALTLLTAACGDSPSTPGAGTAPAGAAGTLELPPASVPAPLRGVPDAATTGAPARWTPGLRLAFFSTNAVTHSDPGKMGMHRDPNGEIRDDKGGRWTMSKPVADSAGGIGYTIIDVVGGDAGGLVLDQRLYFLPQGERGPAIYTSSSAVRVPPAGGDFFLHPALLAKVEPVDEGGINVIRERFDLGGKTVAALRYTATTAGYSSRVYDLESGILLTEAYAYKASQGAVMGDDRYIRDATAKTSGTHRFLGARTTALPWLGGTMPAWVGRVRRLVYRGGIVSRSPGLPDNTAGLTTTYTRQVLGPSWAIYEVSTVGDPQPGIPQIPVVGTFASGGGSGLGLWIDPSILANLEQGRVLDEDPLLRARTSVAGTGTLPDGRAVVTISVDSPLQRIDRLYDVKEGRILSVTMTETVPGTNLTKITRLDLVSTE